MRSFGFRFRLVDRQRGSAGPAVGLSYDAANRLTTIAHQVAGGTALATYT